MTGKWIISNSAIIFLYLLILIISTFNRGHVCMRTNHLLTFILISCPFSKTKQAGTFGDLKHIFAKQHNLKNWGKKRKKKMSSAVFTQLIISLCLLSYLNTNYCFLPVQQKGWGCIFKQPHTINYLNTPSTDNMCVSLCQSLSSQLSSYL